MRIGIDLRTLCKKGQRTIGRGVGRYTQMQIREVLRQDSQNEYILFCEPPADVSVLLPEIRSAPNVSIKIAPFRRKKRLPHQVISDNALKEDAAFQEWIYSHRIDLYHFTTPFLLDNMALFHFNACPYVVTFYDVIPLIYPHRYLRDFSVEYTRVLDFVRRADRIIAISEAARDDAEAYLGYDRNKIEVAYPVADSHFRVLSESDLEESIRPLAERVGLPSRYILTVADTHHSKNLETLFIAYSHLPATLRHNLPLINTLRLKDQEREHFKSLWQTLHIEKDIISTGYVSDEELTALYNQAMFVVHPSLYEGFGLPVVEAMQCGTPVITTTSSSLPEAGGTAAIQVNPKDSYAFADAMSKLYHSQSLREDMARRGLEHAKRFNLTQLGEKSRAAYQATIAPNLPEASKSPLRIAMWTPVPPQKSGVADYSAELLGQLARLADVEVFVDDNVLPTRDMMRSLPVQHFSAFERRMKQNAFDVVIYQLGASLFHAYMHRALQSAPGIVVLHDLQWGRILYKIYRQKRRILGFEYQLALLEGFAALWKFRKMKKQGKIDVFDSFFEDHLMLKQVIDSSLAQIVHADSLRSILTSHYSSAQVYCLDMGVEDPWRQAPVSLMDFDEEYPRLNSNRFVIGIFGIVDRVKRIESIIQAVAKLAAQQDEVLLLIAGEIVESAYGEKLQKIAQDSGIEDKVFITEYVPRFQFYQLLMTCDVVVSLREHSVKQMSAVIIRAIAAGKPIIISDIPQWSVFPEDFCWRVPIESQEINVLTGYLTKLAGDPSLRNAMGRRARAYYLAHNTMEAMALEYISIIEKVAESCAEDRTQ